VLKTFKEQVAYLKQYCLQIACARSIVGSANQMVSLTADEVKALKEQTPRCVERCQR
jgi:hypothetical protein